LFRGRIPEKLILEELPFFNSASDNTIRYPILVIPLEGETLVLDPFSFQIEGETLQIPRLSLRVIAEAQGVNALPEPPQDKTGEPLDPEQPLAIPEAAHLPFPQGQKTVFPLFQGVYNRIIGTAKTYWDEGRRPLALALMRKSERDSFLGPYLTPLRQEMEKTLGLGFTGDEPWRFWNKSVFPWFIYFIILISTLLILNAKAKPLSLKGYICVILIAILGGMGTFFISSDSFRGLLDLHPSAVLESTPAYRIPDFTGVVLAHFAEGEPVKIRSSSAAVLDNTLSHAERTKAEWIYVESIDGRSGWVMAETLYFY
jgi:hypothetical protein